jgi:hypothetical protein
MAFWRIITGRKDPGQTTFKEYAVPLVETSRGAQDADAIPRLGPDGKLDPSFGGGGTGTGGNFLQVTVDFGSGNETDIARLTVAATWVTSNSVILCTPFAGDTPDHSGDEVIAEGLVAYAENLVPGVGFDVVALAPNGTTGRYLINAFGV